MEAGAVIVHKDQSFSIEQLRFAQTREPRSGWTPTVQQLPQFHASSMRLMTRLITHRPTIVSL